MKLNIRKLKESDWDTLVKWWTQHEFGIVPKKCLPPDGIIVEENNIPVCAGGLYRCINSNFSLAPINPI